VDGAAPVKLLLDTHVWIWSLQSPEKLGRTVRRQVENARNELYLSPISIWEVCHLKRRGRLRTRQSFSEWLEQARSRMPLLEAPFNFAVAAEAARIELPPADLGDLFLAATASVYGLTLATADSQLLQCTWLQTLPAD
jgi:PIN domain nuclease of toxin-antitoxin system